MAAEEVHDPRRGRDEVPCQVGERRLADDDKKRDAVSNDRSQLVGPIANSGVVSDGDPALGVYRAKPFIVSRVVSEVIGVAFNGKACRGQDIRELLSEIAISEEDNAQAARS